jgi:hypothetical protein
MPTRCGPNGCGPNHRASNATFGSGLPGDDTATPWVNTAYDWMFWSALYSVHSRGCRGSQRAPLGPRALVIAPPSRNANASH